MQMLSRHWFQVQDTLFPYLQEKIGPMGSNHLIFGRGVKKSDVEAVKWLQKAAVQGDARAQTNLGEMYRDGRGGLKKSDLDAAGWYRKACGQGYEKARPYLEALNQKILEQKKMEGDKEKFEQKHANFRDPSKAVSLNKNLKYLQDAANQGNADAQFNLGIIYAFGKQAAKNEVEAVKWYHKAAKQGHVAAQLNLGGMYQGGHGVPQSYSKAIPSKVGNKYRRSANLGCANAQYNLGI